MKYIYHHLGLGDHIICNGLVRMLIKLEPKLIYGLFTKHSNKNSVKFMYRDLLNLKIIEVDNDCCVKKFIYDNNVLDSNLLVCGFKEPTTNISWDELFYNQHNFKFENRWNMFKVERDFSREISLYEQLNPKNEKYVLLHAKGSDNIDRINYNCVAPTLKKIFVEKYTDNIFDYLTLIELASEIHCVSSSFHVLVDSLPLTNKLFLHTIFKSRGFTHNVKNTWQIV